MSLGRAIRVVAVALVLASSACSFLTVERLELGYRKEQMPRCSVTFAPVAGDIGMALLSAVTMAIWLERIQWVEPRPEDHFYRREAIAWGAIASTHVLSTAYGIWQRGRCHRARDAHSEWVIERTTPEVVPAGPPGRGAP